MRLRVTTSPVANTPVTLPVMATLPLVASLAKKMLSAVTGLMDNAVWVGVSVLSSAYFWAAVALSPPVPLTLPVISLSVSAARSVAGTLTL